MLLLLCICTKISNSLDQPWRQWRSRYAFHAGRNLPDKEFRYLRTVRVTAAVYQGLKSKLVKPFLFTFWHRAGVRPYTSFFNLAESCVFNKQSLLPILCHPPGCPAGPPYSEVTELICRVPSQWLFQRCGVLHLFTCVGVGTVYFSCPFLSSPRRARR